VVQIGANAGNDALQEILQAVAMNYNDLELELVLVEPTLTNFKNLKKNYASNSLFARDNVKIHFVDAAVCTGCCSAANTTKVRRDF
jgi:hypothetical protein